jgi:large subunit ribosomal protein L15
MSLNNLKAPKGAKHARKRVGRGQASGLGKTAGRGGKGQKARTGNKRFEGFEGGQMPLQRRLPKFGFNNLFRKEFLEVQVADLALLPAGEVTKQGLREAGLVKADGLVVVLGNGELSQAYTVKVDRVTKGARAIIENAGGKVELLPQPRTLKQVQKEKRAAEKKA